jgi:hypothetical protein
LGVLGDPIDAKGVRLLDQHTEQPVTDRKLADRRTLLGRDAGRVELGEMPTVRAEDAEGTVPSPGDLGAELDDPLEDRIKREL